MGFLNDTPHSFFAVGLSTLALLLLGALAGPNTAAAQEDPELSFPITVSTDAGGTQELSLGLDPEATAGIDTSLGEEEQPPVPPSNIFDARLIDDDVPPTGFGEGLVNDFRDGSASFAGTKEHEVQIQPDSGATEATIAWDLPAGVTGTLTDVITDGGLVNEPMEGSGSFTLTNLDVTKLFVTLEYSGSANQPPTASDDSYATTQDSALSITDPANGVLANDSDPDGDSLTASLVSGVSDGTLSLDSNGSLEYVPDSGFTGTDQFTYEASDGAAADTAAVSISVQPDDGEAEVQFPITVSTDNGDSQALDLGLDPGATDGIDPALGEEEQPPLPPSDIFDARLIDDDVPPTGFGEGLLTDIRPGSADFTGTKEHEVKVQPGEGANSVTVSWALPPGVTGQLQDATTGGDIVDEPMTGSDSFTYENLNVTELLATLEYGAPNTPPETSDDSYTAVEGQILQVGSADGVLANDTDPDGDELTASVVSGASNGTLTLNADGSFSYGPEEGFTGTDSFTYEATDGRGGTAQATATIEVQPQQPADLAIPFTVTADTSMEQLTMGLDPDATDGIDSELGEEEQPPLPPSDVFDARWIDDDVPASGFGEGILTDIRPGDTSFVGTKVHEVNVQPGGTAEEVTFSWNLPPGVTGTLEDVVTDGDEVSVPMEGEGSFTLTNLNITKLYVTLEYTLGNAPPTVVIPLPDDTLLTPGPPLQLTGLQSVFNDPDGDPLTFSATSSDSGVVEVLGASPQVVILDPVNTGSSEISIVAADPSGLTNTTTFTTVVEDRPSGEQPPAAKASAAVPPEADSAAAAFGETGVAALFRDVGNGGTVEVSFFPDSTNQSSGEAPAFVPADSFQNVSRYRWNINNQGVTFDSVDVAFALSNPSVIGVGEPGTVTVIKDENGDGDFQVVPTDFVGGDTPDPTDDVLVARDTSFSTYKFASDDEDNPLPVELTEFTARLDDEAAVLQWRTASETNNAGFEVQHQGPEADRYVEAGFVESKADGGTTTETTAYQYEVTDLAPGTHQFRLRQVDTDGTGHLSTTTAITVRMEEAVRLMAPAPNPVRSQAQLRFGVQKAGEATVSLYNVLGQEVATVYEGTPTPGEMQTVQLGASQLSELPSGVYFVRLEANGKVRTQRMVRVR